MGSISRDIYTLSARRVAAIDIVYGSAVPIHFKMMDITIPDGAAVVFYAQQQDGPVYRADGWQDGKTAGFTPPEGFFKIGHNLLQVEINGRIIPVAIDVKCHERLSGAGSEATPEQVRPLVEQALDAARDARDRAAEALDSKNAAAGSASAAAGSAGAAASSAQEAQEALEKTTSISVRHPYIGANGNWFVWSLDADAYVDSGVKAQGPQGDPGPGKVNTVCSVAPDDSGNVLLTAENVGARPGDWAPTAQEIGAVAENDLLSKTYPVGSIYLSAEETSPASLFGGTWERLKDRFLLAAGDSYTPGATGGEAEHTLTVEEMPQHAHTQWLRFQAGSDASTYAYQALGNSTGGPANSGNTSGTGGGQAHNNMPPYLAVYMWKRVA